MSYARTSALQHPEKSPPRLPSQLAAEARGILAKLAQLRPEAGRTALPFETLVPLTTPPDIDTFRQLEAQGMTGGISYPFKFALGERSSLDDKKRHMENFAETIMRKCG